MEIRLELSDWLYNAGLVGIMNIFDRAEVPYEKSRNAITFQSEVLEDFSEYYFEYFCEKYESFTSWYKIVSNKSFLDQIDIKTLNEKQFNTLNKYIEDTKKKLQSNSYKNTYHLIRNSPHDISKLATELKKIKKKKTETFVDIQEDISRTIATLQQIILCLKHPDTKRYIMARNVVYEVIQQFWEGVSFLHKSANKKDMYEECKRYFVDPILSYIEEKEEEKMYSKYKYNCFNCENKFSKLGSAYELTWINKTGVDSARKSSHFWNYISDAYVCPVCNLIYACIPAGFTIINGKGLFINETANVKELHSLNQLVLYKGESVQGLDSLEEQSYFRIVDVLGQAGVQHAKKEIQNIQIIKFDGANTSRPYAFNILSKEKLLIMEKNKKHLARLVGRFVKEGKEYISLYQEVTKRLYNNQNQFDLLYRLFRLVLGNEYKMLSVLKSILYINNSQFKGGKEQVYYKQINQFQEYGFQLRKTYVGNENKLSGITYRLLNALKLKNSHRFMDTLVNAYMYKGQQIPMNFVQALHDEMKFQTIGYAFLLGLQGEQQKLEKGEEIKNAKKGANI
ncbi:type I-B CRISPR-associated protein Cas8b1/Cst1 [Bacillus pseudomycoides]|uniref:type I-B CRISPR-associated protein Cas8b1/Cst1 n=1 Tax=Bacillus pseudomycoides TaxID=64104 RepID=UPI000BF24A40|nr:type I-B CRISPR-associated protein Cas8b1/Cst1 [Bacillus pseudomycoides]PEJ36426.1 type I-B CRISPR-associated protein Cas8b1/Cst1 [Bacillus pseudomycoides]